MAELTPELAPVRPGDDLDWPRIESYLRAEVPELEGPFSVLQFPYGSANLTYLLRFGDTELVLRRPPFGELAPGAHDMRREHRVLSVLWRHWDKAPRSYLLCQDPAIAGADFFVMERRTGEVVREGAPASMAHHADLGRRVSMALVDAMAEMHLLDPDQCEIGDLGRPSGFVERQVSGWAKRWDLARPEGAGPLMDELAVRLQATIPEPSRASLVHNDLKLDNVQFDPDDPDRVKSFFDWDMATLGDPLIDLGTLLNYWPDPADEVPRTTREGLLEMGLPGRGEIIDRYIQRTGVSADAVAWFEAFALWKTAVVIQQLWNRWKSGVTKDDRMAGREVEIIQKSEDAKAVLDAVGL